MGTTENHDSRREDKYRNLGNCSDIIREASKFCHCPLTVGGGIKNIDDIDSLFHEGADKIVVNSAFYDNPEAIKIAAENISQSITASIDLKRGDNLMAYKHNGQSRTTMTLIDSINNARGLGVEILLSQSTMMAQDDMIKILRTLNEETDFL